MVEEVLVAKQSNRNIQTTSSLKCLKEQKGKQAMTNQLAPQTSKRLSNPYKILAHLFLPSSYLSLVHSIRWNEGKKLWYRKKSVGKCGDVRFEVWEIRRIFPSYFTHGIMFHSYIVFGCHVALFGCEIFNPDSTMTSGHLPGSISVICINFPEPPQTTRRLESRETMVFLIYVLFYGCGMMEWKCQLTGYDWIV